MHGGLLVVVQGGFSGLGLSGRMPCLSGCAWFGPSNFFSGGSSPYFWAGFSIFGSRTLTPSSEGKNLIGFCGRGVRAGCGFSESSRLARWFAVRAACRKFPVSLENAGRILRGHRGLNGSSFSTSDSLTKAKSLCVRGLYERGLSLRFASGFSSRLFPTVLGAV